MPKSDKMILYGGIIGAFILPSIFLFFDAFKGSSLNAENASQYGDFVGGYIGTILTFISILLLYFTLKNQRESNDKNLTSAYIEKFENKFFEMIKMHRENVAEAGIKDTYGRRLFVLLLREFREIVLVIDNYLKEQNKYNTFTTEEKYDIAYCVLFYGIGPNSTRLLNSVLAKYKDTKELINNLIELFEDEERNKEIQIKRKFKYKLFEGHQSRLGHYYRHLYQTVCYVHTQSSTLLSDEEKYKYVKILRAQLSNHEQALLFLNSLSYMGKEWKDDCLIERYKLIKNLPEDFFDKDKEINVKDIYPKITFEWEE